MKDRKNSSLLRRLEKFQRLFFVALLSVLAVGAFAQSKTVSGTVLDKTGESVIGASVVVKGTTNGTITDFDGKFTLQNVPDNGTIQVSFVGYKTVDIQVKGQSTVKIILEEDTETLDEVVVVGYGVQKKSDVTGAMARVTSKVIEDRPVQNALQAMQGRVTGVDITSNNRPGELGDIRIRGNRSLTADNNPLYVIDGIPMSAGSIADVNPSDIESMEILKDASATAIYGSRGANGVILVTTKKGKTGRTTINYDGSFSFGFLDSTTDYMNSGQLLDYNRQSAITGGTYNGRYGDNPDPERDKALWLNPNNMSYMDKRLEKVYQQNADGTYSYEAGDVYMDGAKALRFARERYNLGGGDRDRGKNQMRVITGIINKAISPSIITNYTSILDAVSGSFQTNMSNSEMTSLIKMQINDMSGWDIEQISVNGTGNGSAWSPANGFNSWVMEPNVNTVKRAVEVIKKVENGEDVKALAQQVMEENTADE